MHLDEAHVVALHATPDGGVLATLSFEGTLEVAGAKLEGRCSSEGHASLALIRLDGSGGRRWTKVLPCAEPTALAVDREGGSAIAALFSGVLDLGDGPLKPRGSSRDLLVLRLDGDGAVRWKRTHALERPQRISDLAFDAAGNLYYTGGLLGGTPIGGAKVGPILPDHANLMLGSLDATGTPRDAKVFPSIVWQTPRLDVAPDGSLRVAATLRSHKTDVGGGKIGTEGGILLARFDASLGHTWSKVFGGASDAVHDVAIDARGDLWLIGETGGRLDFGGGPLADPTDERTLPVLARIDEHGAHVASRALLGGGGWTPPSAEGTAIAVAPSGGLFVAGRILDGRGDLGDGALGPTAADFVGAFDASLALRWSTFTAGRERFETANHRLSVDPSGGAWLAYDVLRKMQSDSSHGLVLARFAP